jgi:hypothetical protein
MRVKIAKLMTRGSRREGQRHALCMRWCADVMRAMKGKHESYV